MKPVTRGLVGSGASALCLGIASTAHAVCMSSDSSLGVGLPSISATEVSTTQVVEMVQQRQQQEQQAPVPVSTPAVAAPAASTPAASEPPKPKPAPVAATPAPKAKAVAQSKAPAEKQAKSTAAQAEDEEAEQPSAKATKKPADPGTAAKKPVKDETVATAKEEKVVAVTTQPKPVRYADDEGTSNAVGRYGRGPSSFGVWTQGYGDFEHRSGLTIDIARPGEISRNQWSGGFLVGADRTIRQGIDNGLTLGVFGGHNTTHAKESSGLFRDQQNGLTENFLRSDAKSDTTGGFAGAYAALFADKFSLQAVFKADFYSISQQDLLRARFDNGQPCGLPPETRNGTANLSNYITEVNASYRIDLSRSAWLEPIAGFRLTYSEINDETGNVGFAGDGHVLRLQGGLRVAQIWPVHQGFLMTSLTGLLYSDVVVSGFHSNSPFAPASAINDEGQLRVLGQIATRYIVGDGSSYDMQVEGRGGEHLLGFGGRVGARYEW